jgi:alkylation response protein AidB-like acyl-CoA dehydrogenase
MTAALEAAGRLADEVLLPRAAQSDAAMAVPVELLDELAAAGFYGLFGPTEAGGLGLGAAEALSVIERLATGCLTTTFVWLQHHGAVRAVAAAPDQIKEEWLRPLCRGERRSGVAFAGLRRPGPPLLTARAKPGGYVLDGSAPWVTGWGNIDVLLTAARLEDGEGDIAWVLIDAKQGRGLTVEEMALMAVNGSSTVTARFDRYLAPADRLLRTEPFEQWRARDAAGLRTNGSLCLGLAWRCATMLAAPGLHARIDRCREALDNADLPGLPAARAAASKLALDSATSLVVATGGRAILTTELAQVLMRQAVFLLVFGQTAAIRAAQLAAMSS